MDNGKIVWGPHPEHGFVLGTIVDIGHNTITVKPSESKIEVSYEFLYFVLVLLIFYS